MGNPIRQIFKGIVKQTPDVVEQISRTVPRSIHDASPELIAGVPNIRLSPTRSTQTVLRTTPTHNTIPIQTITDPISISSAVFPNQTVTNRLGVQMGIGNDVSFNNGQLTGTLFSGNRRYNLSKIYDDFQRKGIDRRFLGNWMYGLGNNIEEIVRRLPLTDDFQPNLDFAVRNWSNPNTTTYTPRQYWDLMKSGGYNEDAIKHLFAQSAERYILNGESVPNWSLDLDYNNGRFIPRAITEYNFTQFRPEHIIQNMTEPIALGVFGRALNDSFGRSHFNYQTNTPKFDFRFTPIDDVRQAASNILTAKHPEFNFDPSLVQFTAARSADNVPTINWLRDRYKGMLPFDFSTFIWDQGKIRPKRWGVRQDRPNVGMDVYKTLGALKESVPRGYAITETNTSPDSEALKLAMAARNYGTNPGQTSVQVVRPDAHRNTLQNNAVWFEDLVNDPDIPQDEVAKLRRIMTEGGLWLESGSEWYNSEAYKRAQFLYNQAATKDMYKLYKGWHRLKKLDPTIKSFNISVEPFSKDMFEILFKTGTVAPPIHSPDFHIIKHKNGGRLLKSLNDAINKLKNNNKFGN